MMLQACRFLRIKPEATRKRDFKWEHGFAKVKAFGHYDVDWIIDQNGDKVPAPIYDYVLLNDYPGSMCEIPESQIKLVAEISPKLI
jgi:hypothetical protein